MPETRKLLNITQLAERLDVPVVTLRYWLRHGRCPIPYIEGTKPRKFLAAEVDRFLAGKANGK